jgi:hypothetical protein
VSDARGAEAGRAVGQGGDHGDIGGMARSGSPCPANGWGGPGPLGQGDFSPAAFWLESG